MPSDLRWQANTEVLVVAIHKVDEVYDIDPITHTALPITLPQYAYLSVGFGWPSSPRFSREASESFQKVVSTNGKHLGNRVTNGTGALDTKVNAANTRLRPI